MPRSRDDLGRLLGQPRAPPRPADAEQRLGAQLRRARPPSRRRCPSPRGRAARPLRSTPAPPRIPPPSSCAQARLASARLREKTSPSRSVSSQLRRAIASAASVSPRIASRPAWLLRTQLAVSGSSSSSGDSQRPLEQLFGLLDSTALAPHHPLAHQRPRRSGCRGRCRRRPCGRRRRARASRRGSPRSRRSRRRRGRRRRRRRAPPPAGAGSPDSSASSIVSLDGLDPGRAVGAARPGRTAVATFSSASECRSFCRGRDLLGFGREPRLLLAAHPHPPGVLQLQQPRVDRQRRRSPRSPPARSASSITSCQRRSASRGRLWPAQ